MERYSLEQRIEIIKIHYENGENFAETVRKVRTAFGRNISPSRPAIINLVRKFERLGQVTDIKKPHRARLARSNENILAVAESVAEDPRLSIRRRSKKLGVSIASLYRILHEDLGFRAYNPANEYAETVNETDHNKTSDEDDIDLKPAKRRKRLHVKPIGKSITDLKSINEEGFSKDCLRNEQNTEKNISKFEVVSS